MPRACTSGHFLSRNVGYAVDAALRIGLTFQVKLRVLPQQIVPVFPCHLGDTPAV